MYLFLLVAALLAASGLATPLAHPNAATRRSPHAGFSLPVQRKNLSHMRSGASVTAKTYKKYNATLPQGHLNTGVSRIKVNAATGSVNANPSSYDSEYLATVWVGAQQLSLDLDTGSSDLWVFSSELPLDQQTGHGIYNPNKSSTARKLSDQTWEISYGDGSSASGDVWSDCVWVGGTIVEGQAVEAARSVSSSFQADVDNDGLMGLGFDALNDVVPTLQSTFLSNAIQQGLPQPLFTVSLKYRAAGSFDFGYIDNTKYSGAISYVPVDSSLGYWRINTATFGFRYSNGSSVQYPFVGDSIVDTGTSLTYLSNQIVRGYWDLVPGAGYDNTQAGYTFPCDLTNSLPDLTIGIGNYTARIPGHYLAYAPITDDGVTCYGGLQSNQGLPFSILGDTFLKSVFAVFDAGSSPRLGFADQA